MSQSPRTIEFVKKFFKFLLFLSVAALMAFLVWVFLPISPRAQSSYSKIALASSSPLTAPQVRALSVNEWIRPSSQYRLVAERSCRGRFLQLVMGSRKRSLDDCISDVESSREGLQLLLEHYAQLGVRVNRDLCIATDDAGEVTDLVSGLGDLGIFIKIVLRNGGSLPSDPAIASRFHRLMGVGICSLQKSADYWAEHPSEMPESDEIASYLYFDPHSGKPEKLFVVDKFLKIVEKILPKNGQ